MDKDQIKAVLEAVSETLRGLQTGDEPEEKTAAAEADYGYDGWSNKVHRKCVAPRLVLYFVFTECVTINNGACPDWEFCEDDKGHRKPA